MKTAIIAAVMVAVLGGLGLVTIEPPSHLVEGGAPDVEPVAQMPVEIVADEQPEDAPESAPEPIWQEEWAGYEYEGEPENVEPYTANESAGVPDLRTMGRVNDGENEWTWYSENVLPGDGLDELNANGRHVGEGGYVVDADGYIAVASPWGADAIGTVVETPWGPGKVYDANEGGSYDVYTSW